MPIYLLAAMLFIVDRPPVVEGGILVRAKWPVFNALLSKAHPAWVRPICYRLGIDILDPSHSLAPSHRLLPRRTVAPRTLLGRKKARAGEMATIVFASSKGGVGKSTTALALSQALARAGAQVELLDADPNSPMAAWANLSDGSLPENLTLAADVNEENILERIDLAAERSNFVIVDLEGSANMAVSYAIGRADLILIPMQGSQLDANEAAKVIRLIKREERAYKRSIRFAAVLTRTKYITPRTAKHIRGIIEGAGIPILPVELMERDAFKAIFTFGGSIYELTSEEVSAPEKAVENIEAFAQCVVAHIKETADA